MPHVLIAGIVESSPKAEPFPAQGRPRTDIKIRSEDGRPTIFLVRGYDEQADELALLAVGDSVAVAGRLELEAKDGKIASLFIVARQTVPIIRRSRNRFGGI